MKAGDVYRVVRPCSLSLAHDLEPGDLVSIVGIEEGSPPYLHIGVRYVDSPMPEGCSDVGMGSKIEPGDLATFALAMELVANDEGLLQEPLGASECLSASEREHGKDTPRSRSRAR